jgi:hypothetical protein
LALLASPYETANGGGSLSTVRFQMILVTFHISKVTVAIGAFDGGAVRYIRGVGQTKRATMRVGSTVFFDVVISFVTMFTIVSILGHPRCAGIVVDDRLHSQLTIKQ